MLDGLSLNTENNFFVNKYRQFDSKLSEFRGRMETESTDISMINNIKDPKKRLSRATQEMESLFVKMMLDAMRKTVVKSGLLDGGQAEEVFSDMLYTEHAKNISRTGSVGLAKILYNQYEKHI
ncbi:MAG: hypothetical protein A2096_12090 [Spirochaetes bacterium GWF1_41_5]|nr:MAG: hypothetical protein A2096_12090 [Spirochaetes bacterium GWF1_41_5]HBE03915.1 flagellar biosynthesis protein FlgJ [Spirochaetia bacterium]